MPRQAWFFLLNMEARHLSYLSLAQPLKGQKRDEPYETFRIPTGQRHKEQMKLAPFQGQESSVKLEIMIDFFNPYHLFFLPTSAPPTWSSQQPLSWELLFIFLGGETVARGIRVGRWSGGLSLGGAGVDSGRPDSSPCILSNPFYLQRCLFLSISPTPPHYYQPS